MSAYSGKKKMVDWAGKERNYQRFSRGEKESKPPHWTLM